MTSISVLLLIVGLFIFLLYSGAFGKIPSKENLQEVQNETASLVYSSDQLLLGKFFAENRTNIEFNELPTELVHALVATEDARFFEHEGVDRRSMLRVLLKTFMMGERSAGGGSTITQQLAKNLFGRNDYGRLSIFINKFKEMILADRLEEIYTKEEILTLYLNTVPFGENIFGIESASQRFFDKKTSQLQTEEAAVLVGLLKANTFYNPRLHPKNALQRRNVVLAQMEKYGYLLKEQADSLQAIPLLLNYSNLDKQSPAPYFLVHVRRKAEEIVKKYNRINNSSIDLEKDGLLITTTLNKNVQSAIGSSVIKQLASFQGRLRKLYEGKSKSAELHILAKKVAQQQNLDIEDPSIKQREFYGFDSVLVMETSILDSIKYSLTQLHAGAIAVNPKTGATLAWIGGIDFQKYPYDQVIANRQLASTFKPILYAAAIEDGADACDYLQNDELVLADYDNWQPRNYDNEVGGNYSLAASLAFSKNIPTVNLFFRLGFEKLEKMWDSMGFSSSLENQPSVSLGTVSANLLELSRAYGSFPNMGKKVETYFIEEIKTADGKILYSHKPQEPIEIYSAQTALQINEILLKATNEGTGASIRSRFGIHYPLAGKTGTSQNFSDAWYVCYTNNFVLASRVGAALPSIHFTSGSDGSGSRLALPIAGMSLKALQKTSFGKLLQTSGVESSHNINCPDFKEDSFIEGILDIFSKPKTTREKQQKKQKRKKKGNIFDRLFGK